VILFNSALMFKISMMHIKYNDSMSAEKESPYVRK
jgi:hypothetical protein